MYLVKRSLLKADFYYHSHDLLANWLTTIKHQWTTRLHQMLHTNSDDFVFKKSDFFSVFWWDFPEADWLRLTWQCGEEIPLIGSQHFLLLKGGPAHYFLLSFFLTGCMLLDEKAKSHPTKTKRCMWGNVQNTRARTESVFKDCDIKLFFINESFLWPWRPTQI